jgi:polynucleotide 5'-kinase involved in rRNA processing
MSEDIKNTPVATPDATPAEAIKGDDTTPKESKVEITPEVQKVIDGAIEARLKREREQHQRELEEERRLAKLSEDERQAELQKKYEQDLSSREVQLRLAENKLAYTKKFEADGLPTEMLDYIVSEDLDSTTKRYDEFKATWNATLNKKLEERVKPTSNPASFQSNSVKKQDIIRVL